MFKVYDNQLSRYAFEGKKFKTKEEAIEQLLSFFSVDNNKKELKEIEMMLKSDNEFADMVIRKLR